VVAEQVDVGMRESMVLTLHGVKLDKKDFFGKSDPFLNIYRLNTDGRSVLLSQP
jgi:hypothetical protein